MKQRWQLRAGSVIGKLQLHCYNLGKYTSQWNRFLVNWLLPRLVFIQSFPNLRICFWDIDLVCGFKVGGNGDDLCPSCLNVFRSLIMLWTVNCFAKGVFDIGSLIYLHSMASNSITNVKDVVSDKTAVNGKLKIVE